MGAWGLLVMHAFHWFVIVHDHRHWRYNIPALVDAGYKVYALDLLGFGASDKPQQPYTMETWAELVGDFMDEFVQNKPTVLVGNSIGSLVALMVPICFLTEWMVESMPMTDLQSYTTAYMHNKTHPCMHNRWRQRVHSR